MANCRLSVCLQVVMLLSWVHTSLSQNVTMIDDVSTVTNSTDSASVVTSGTVDTTSERIPTVPVTSDTEACYFEPTDPKTRDKFSETLKTSSSLIRFKFRFVNSSSGDFYPDDILNSDGGTLFRPNLWTRVTSVEGQTLLMLDDNFEVLSLSLLGIGIKSMDVDLTDKPNGCITGLNSSDRVQVLRHLLLNDFKVTDSQGGRLGSNEGICNQRIHIVNGKATCVYECCHIDSDGQMVCGNVEQGVWITVLLVSIFIIKVLAALYSPYFLPETYYRQKYTDVDYVYHFPDGKSRKKLRIVKTMNPEYYESENQPVRMVNLEGLPNLNSSVECMHTDEIQDLHLDQIHFTVEMRRLLSEQYVPVSVIRMINDNIFRCKIRNIPAFKPCCDTGICTALHHRWKIFTWFSCVRILAKLIFIGILAIPWLIRLTVYFRYEAEFVEELRNNAKKFHANLQFDFNFTRYLSPLHPVYIFAYIVVSIDALVYGFMGTDMKTQLRLTLRSCLRQMRERSLTDVYSWAVRWLLAPLTRFGILGILVLPLYWPFLMIILIPVFAVTTFPALYLSLKFIFHPFGLICQKCIVNEMKISTNIKTKITDKEKLFEIKEDLTKKDICLQSCVIIGCLVSFWSVTFLLMECLYFFVEVAVYTLMGVIVNAGATLRYVTLFFLVWVYAKDSLLGVHKLYLSYHQIIRKQLISGKQEEMLKVAKENDLSQENTAFRVQSSLNAADISSGVELEVTNGVLNWKTSGLLVFLDKKDTPFTPLKFFFETIDLDCCGAPGPLWKNTLAAFYSLMKMVVFLFFVVAVVLAFGNQFSSTNQLLAILAGGFLPFIMRNILKRDSGVSNVNTSSVHFATEFDKLLAGYKQKWPVADIIFERQSTSREKSATVTKRHSNRSEKIVAGSVTAKSSSEDNTVEFDVSNDRSLSIDSEVELVDMRVDLIVHVSSGEKMRHLVKTCVNVDCEKANTAELRTSASFSNPMFSHT